MGIFSPHNNRAFKKFKEFESEVNRQMPTIAASLNHEQEQEYFPMLSSVYSHASTDSRSFLLVPASHTAKDHHKLVMEVLRLLDEYNVPGGALFAPNVEEFGINKSLGLLMPYLQTVKPAALRVAADLEDRGVVPRGGGGGGAGAGAAAAAGAGGAPAGPGARQTEVGQTGDNGAMSEGGQDQGKDRHLGEMAEAGLGGAALAGGAGLLADKALHRKDQNNNSMPPGQSTGVAPGQGSFNSVQAGGNAGGMGPGGPNNNFQGPGTGPGGLNGPQGGGMAGSGAPGGPSGQRGSLQGPPGMGGQMGPSGGGNQGPGMGGPLAAAGAGGLAGAGLGAAAANSSRGNGNMQQGPYGGATQGGGPTGGGYQGGPGGGPGGPPQSNMNAPPQGPYSPRQGMGGMGGPPPSGGYMQQQQQPPPQGGLGMGPPGMNVGSGGGQQGGGLGLPLAVGAAGAGLGAVGAAAYERRQQNRPSDRDRPLPPPPGYGQQGQGSPQGYNQRSSAFGPNGPPPPANMQQGQYNQGGLSQGLPNQGGMQGGPGNQPGPGYGPQGSPGNQSGGGYGAPLAAGAAGAGLGAAGAAAMNRGPQGSSNKDLSPPPGYGGQGGPQYGNNSSNYMGDPEFSRNEARNPNEIRSPTYGAGEYGQPSPNGMGSQDPSNQADRNPNEIAAPSYGGNQGSNAGNQNAPGSESGHGRGVGTMIADGVGTAGAAVLGYEGYEALKNRHHKQDNQSDRTIPETPSYGSEGQNQQNPMGSQQGLGGSTYGDNGSQGMGPQNGQSGRGYGAPLAAGAAGGLAGAGLASRSENPGPGQGQGYDPSQAGPGAYSQGPPGTADNARGAPPPIDTNMGENSFPSSESGKSPEIPPTSPGSTLSNLALAGGAVVVGGLAAVVGGSVAATSGAAIAGGLALGALAAGFSSESPKPDQEGTADASDSQNRGLEGAGVGVGVGAGDTGTDEGKPSMVHSAKSYVQQAAEGLGAAVGLKGASEAATAGGAGSQEQQPKQYANLQDEVNDHLNFTPAALRTEGEDAGNSTDRSLPSDAPEGSRDETGAGAGMGGPNQGQGQGNNQGRNGGGMLGTAAAAGAAVGIPGAAALASRAKGNEGSTGANVNPIDQPSNNLPPSQQAQVDSENQQLPPGAGEGASIYAPGAQEKIEGGQMGPGQTGPPNTSKVTDVGANNMASSGQSKKKKHNFLCFSCGGGAAANQRDEYS